jgi:membrane-associated phospholipid phosphatase
VLSSRKSGSFVRRLGLVDFSGARIWGQVVVIAGALAVYQIAHVVSGQHAGAALAHAAQVLRFEHSVGVDWEHGAQSFVLRHEWLQDVSNAVYTWMYWPVILGGLALLWHFDRRSYMVLRNGMLLSGAAGLVVFLLYPVAPPRMLDGFTDTISPGSVEHVVVHGSIADPFAALPSFHAGWVALTAILLAMASRRRQRPALILAVIGAGTMCLAVVTTANHYVVDVISGVVVSLVGGALAFWIQVRFERPDLSVSDRDRVPVDSTSSSRG